MKRTRSDPGTDTIWPPGGGWPGSAALLFAARITGPHGHASQGQSPQGQSPQRPLPPSGLKQFTPIHPLNHPGFSRWTAAPHDINRDDHVAVCKLPYTTFVFLGGVPCGRAGRPLICGYSCL